MRRSLCRVVSKQEPALNCVKSNPAAGGENGQRWPPEMIFVRFDPFTCRVKPLWAFQAEGPLAPCFNFFNMCYSLVIIRESHLRDVFLDIHLQQG